MLKALIVTLVLGMAALSIDSVDHKAIGTLVVIALLNIGFARNQPKTHSKLFAELKLISVLVARLSVGLAVLAALIALLTPAGLPDTLHIAILVSYALLPVQLAITVSYGVTVAKPQILAKITANVLAIKFASLITLLVGLLGVWFTHYLLPINLAQLALVDLLTLPPLLALAHDTARKKQHASSQSLLELVSFSGLIGLLSYGNYLLFFARHSLSPFRLEANLPLYQQAATLTCLTLLCCFTMQILFIRAYHHSEFFTDYLSHNNKLPTALGIMAAGLICASYLPPLQHYFGTAALGITDWATAVLAAGIFMSARLLQRHTRQHSRGAVLKLHHEA